MHIIVWYRDTTVFWGARPIAVTKFQGNSLSAGAKYTGWGKKLRLSTEIAVYLGNGTK